MNADPKAWRTLPTTPKRGDRVKHYKGRVYEVLGTSLLRCGIGSAEAPVDAIVYRDTDPAVEARNLIFWRSIDSFMGFGDATAGRSRRFIRHIESAYVAGGLERADAVRLIMGRLRDAGIKITYDWTVHGSVWQRGHDVVRNTAAAEIEGVQAADVVVITLPGGRGTHAELGAALAAGKPVVIMSDVTAPFELNEQTCAFYHHPGVVAHVTTIDGLLRVIG